MAMRHGGGEERPNVSRSAVDNGEAARDEALSAVVGGSLSPRWKCGRLHGSECSADTEADERLLIAVSAGNFNSLRKIDSQTCGGVVASAPGIHSAED